MTAKNLVWPRLPNEAGGMMINRTWRRTWCKPSPWATIRLGSLTIVLTGLPGISSPLNTKWILYSPGLLGVNDTLYRPGAVGFTSTGTFPTGPRHWIASSPSPAPEVSTSKEEGRPMVGLRAVSAGKKMKNNWATKWLAKQRKSPSCYATVFFAWHDNLVSDKVLRDLIDR